MKEYKYLVFVVSCGETNLYDLFILEGNKSLWSKCFLKRPLKRLTRYKIDNLLKYPDPYEIYVHSGLSMVNSNYNYFEVKTRDSRKIRDSIKNVLYFYFV